MKRTSSRRSVWDRLSVIACLVLLFSFTGCSTKKNTPLTRFYHSMTARYNIMYNGQVAFRDGMDAQTEGHNDDYTALLPMYISTNKSTAGIGRGNYETAILKSEKAIKLHSIKRKPAVKPGKKKDQQTKDYLARKEFNPYLWRAWMMLGQSQFQQGEFIEAASTFNYTIRLYSTQPQVANLARTWLAKCYVALDWPYDAEDVLRKLAKDSLGNAVQKSYDSSRTAWLIQTGQYKEAIPLLQKVIKNQRGHIARARLNYLLGQLCHQVGENDASYKALTKVIRANPPYVMSLNAQVLRSEVTSKGHTRQTVRKLQRMARNQNNKDYIDQIYYAIGNIYMNEADTLHSIYAWEKGAKESRGGAAKAQILLRLAQVYWDQENYIDAARCYKGCVSALDKEKPGYDVVEQRSQMLEPLAPHLETIKLQDSLQALAKLSEAEQIAVADRLIKELKKKEKEEARRNGSQNIAQNQNAGQVPNPATAPTANRPTTPGQTSGSTWYYSNPNTVQRGREIFQRKWGRRCNEDNWRWADRSSFGNGDAGGDMPDAGNIADTTFTDTPEIDEEEQARRDSLARDPHHREYYLNQIPNTEEQMEKSHGLLRDALYNAGVLEQDKVGNYPMARRTLERLMRDYPDFEKMDDVFYHMFLICGRLGLDQEAMVYRDSIISAYPDTKMAALLSNPNYDLIARGGRHLEDSVYAATYQAYKDSNYPEIEKNYRFSTENYPEGKHRARFMFIHAMGQLYSGDRQGFLTSLKELVEKYSAEEVAKLAAEIMKGVNEGRLLQDGKWDTSGIWGLRANMAGTDSTEVVQLKDTRIGQFAFVLAYPKNSLDEDQLLFEIARYNFTAFLVRNFGLEISDIGGISMLVVRGFLSYDEVHAYAQQLYSDQHMATVLEGIRTLLIAEDNLKLLGTQFSFDDYKDFYEEKYAPLQVPEDLRIDENQIIEPVDGEDTDGPAGDENTNEDEEEITVDDDDFPYGF